MLGDINRKGCYTLKGFIHFSVLQMIISLPGMSLAMIVLQRSYQLGLD